MRDAIARKRPESRPPLLVEELRGGGDDAASPSSPGMLLHFAALPEATVLVATWISGLPELSAKLSTSTARGRRARPSLPLAGAAAPRLLTKNLAREKT